MARKELIAEVLDDLNKAPGDFTATKIDGWIRKATARINELLRTRDMLAIRVLPVTTARFKLPPDYLSMERVQVNSGIEGGPIVTGSPKGELTYVPADQLALKASADYYMASPRPVFYTLHGADIIELAPYRSGSYQIELEYFAKIPLLGPEDTATHWFLDKYEEVFQNAMMIFGHRTLFEDDRAMQFETILSAQINIMNDRYQNEKHGNGPLMRRPTRKLGGKRS